MQHSAASDLGSHCLHMSYKNDVRLIWIKGKELNSYTKKATYETQSICNVNVLAICNFTLLRKGEVVNCNYK